MKAYYVVKTYEENVPAQEHRWLAKLHNDAQPLSEKQKTAFFLSFCINAAGEFFQKVIAGLTYTSKGLDCKRFIK